jgi:hypothetical protein
MSKRFKEDARRAIEILQETGIAEREGVLVLIFSRRGRSVVGYLNDNPYNAARAMVEFLVEKYPDAKRPAWVRRILVPSGQRKASTATDRTSRRGHGG